MSLIWQPQNRLHTLFAAIHNVYLLCSFFDLAECTQRCEISSSTRKIALCLWNMKHESFVYDVCPCYPEINTTG